FLLIIIQQSFSVLREATSDAVKDFDISLRTVNNRNGSTEHTPCKQHHGVRRERTEITVQDTTLLQITHDASNCDKRTVKQPTPKLANRFHLFFCSDRSPRRS